MINSHYATSPFLFAHQSFTADDKFFLYSLVCLILLKLSFIFSLCFLESFFPICFCLIESLCSSDSFLPNLDLDIFLHHSLFLTMAFIFLLLLLEVFSVKNIERSPPSPPGAKFNSGLILSIQ